MDKLVITGIKLTTLIGTHLWEQQCPQNLYLDLAFAVDTQKISEHDQIKAAINYEEILQTIVDFAQHHHFQLIETLAERLAQQLLAHFPIPWLQLSLHKPNALEQTKDVMVTIERSR